MIIGFHGRFATPKILERDIGDPELVDTYWNKWGYDSIEYCQQFKKVILVGYSFGGAHIARLSQALTNIAGVVLYESPTFCQPEGSFPVLFLRNLYRFPRRRTTLLNDSYQAWSRGRRIYCLYGDGRHMGLTFGIPPLKHAWDKRLNPQIKEFIKTCQ